MFALLVKGLKVLLVNPGYLKFIPGINLSLANEKLFTISFILYLCEILPIRGIMLKGELDLNNNPLASCSLINLNILLLLTTQFDKIITLPFFIFTTF